MNNPIFGCDTRERYVLTAEGPLYQDRKMSKAYRVVDPFDIAFKLENNGYQCEVQTTGRAMGMAKTWNRVVKARTHLDVFGYEAIASILCNHNGHASVCVKPGAFRQFCANEFYGAPVRIRHDRDEIDEFLREPWRFVDKVLAPVALDVTNKVNALRTVGGGHSLMHWLREKHPRLWKRAYTPWEFYDLNCSGKDGIPGSMWAALQAFTEIRSPRLSELTQAALTDDYRYIREGVVPVHWTN